MTNYVFSEGFDGLPSGYRSGSGFLWYRVLPGTSLVVVGLGANPVAYRGHFVAGRMRPCTGSECEHCRGGVPAQIRWVFSVADVRNGVVGLLEVGDATGLAVRDKAISNGGLHGLVMEFSRAGRSKHSRIEVAFLSEVCPVWIKKLQGIDVVKALHSTWAKLEEEESRLVLVK